MSASFLKAVEFVLDNEGGYSDHANDYGGRTRHGITEEALASHLLHHKGCQIRVRDPLSLTTIDAIHIYELDYWQKRFAEIAAQPVASKLLDFCVMRGPAGGVEIVQEAANDAERFNGFAGEHVTWPAGSVRLSVDGVFGPKSLAAVNALPAKALLLSMVRAIALHHGRVVRDSARPGRRDQRPFLVGWLNRAFKIPMW